MKTWPCLILLTLIILASAPVYAEDFILPVAGGNFYITQTPCTVQTGENRSHCEYYSLDREAWDVGCGGYEGCGAVVAVADGVVIEARDNVASREGYGNYIEIRHTNGLVSLYGHLQRGTVTVSEGDHVTQGQILGMVGNSGHSSGAHLHFSFSKNGVPYSSAGLINFSELKGGIITTIFNIIFPKVGGSGVLEPLKPLNLQPLGEMVADFYNWALDIGVAVALGIVIWGGILYISSADNPERQNEAKKWVKAAILGLLILLSAYLILYTINPCLVGTGSGCV